MTERKLVEANTLEELANEVVDKALTGRVDCPSKRYGCVSLYRCTARCPSAKEAQEVFCSRTDAETKFTTGNETLSEGYLAYFRTANGNADYSVFPNAKRKGITS